ncbi:glycosyl hydrolase 115 family protein [Echinicola jeungdonensis]|uniref:Glycosyl hydrolase 115 family protein n=1 Tax=Echinicola jeungdonensis TaxID=709343 RepID=A0ABV5JBM2_9BACT|nr:glycosyl hydrolase 115 family protein [Echinicola jeungdonensis]MDN3670382.1 glycosyl hydrolase 115 family protein [Echinicola jeungdonensis]
MNDPIVKVFKDKILKARKVTIFPVFLLVLWGCAGNNPVISRTEGVNFEINENSTIVYDKNGSDLDSISAHLLSEDIERVIGKRPIVATSFPSNGQSVILIGKIESEIIRNFLGKEVQELEHLKGGWERFSLKVHPIKGQENPGKCLVIAGSDDRGTAFGAFEISERIGVSPWYWWADVPVEKQERVTLADLPYVSNTPSVKYRGIFLNDEDWGLQPWAEKTFESSTGDIGPKTYAKIFELLLRLKANYIWPAMHPSTKAFFHYPGNPEMAMVYQIVVGTSHAEPMLRNNVDEWDHHEMGDFNYQTNKEQVYSYWEKRVKESQGLNAIYTVGMRGIHDSGMEGVDSYDQAAGILENVIADQRGLISEYISKDVEEIPQAFTAYKEVLDIYDAGLDLPEDITMIWPDDNYGYIRRLSNAEERNREGGTGVYYHASYWGRPHDYLWLSTTHPALIREEMMKAYEMDCREIWVLNVGDIKPLEYNIELFMDMAYQADPFKDPSYSKKHLNDWYQSIFGKQGKELGEIIWTYYDLAFERRPEFMGWSQTEPTTPVYSSAYAHKSWGDEAQKRLDAYKNLESRIEDIKASMPEKEFPAFYQLGYYPVISASLMNQKFLYKDKAMHYAEEDRLSALNYKARSEEAYDKIVNETEFYNQELIGGKWNHMMDMAPRNLPVYQKPKIELPNGNSAQNLVGISPEKSAFAKGNEDFPEFNSWTDQKHFLDVYLKQKGEANWRVKASQEWIEVSKQEGKISSQIGPLEERIWVNIDWSKVEKENFEEEIVIQAGNQDFTFAVKGEKRPLPPEEIKHLEGNHFVVINAEDYSQSQASNGQKWEKVVGLGHSGAVMQSLPLKAPSISEDNISENSSHLSYDFFLHHNSEDAEILFTAIPTHPLTDQNELRIAYSVDKGPVKVVDFETHGRSEEWKENVLSNKTTKGIKVGPLEKGKHSVKVYWVDPGVLLDYVYIDLAGIDFPYGKLPSTQFNNQ